MFKDIQNESPDYADQKHRTFSVEKIDDSKTESKRYFENEDPKWKIRFKKHSEQKYFDFSWIQVKFFVIFFEKRGLEVSKGQQRSKTFIWEPPSANSVKSDAGG